MHRFYKLSYVPRLLICFILLGACSCKNEEKASKDGPAELTRSNTQDLKSWPEPKEEYGGIAVYEKFDDLEPVFHFENDTTYVINFWATWCKPCIKELPYFEAVDSLYANQKLKVVLVSLDFPDQIESKLVPFVQEKELKSRVVVLLDGKYNDWIDKVSPQWSGAIPATYIYRNGKNKLIGTSFENPDDIIKELNNFL